MAYLKVEIWTTIYFTHNSTRQAVFKLQQTQGYGNTPVFPYNSTLLLITFVFNMWVKNMPTTFAKYSRNVMKYHNIGMETNLQALTWNSIIPPRTMTAPAAYQSKDTLRNYFSALATSTRSSLSSHPKIIVRLNMDPNYNWPRGGNHPKSR